MGNGLQRQLERAERKVEKRRRQWVTVQLGRLDIDPESPAALMVFDSFRPAEPEDYTLGNIADFLLEVFPTDEEAS